MNAVCVYISTVYVAIRFVRCNMLCVQTLFDWLVISGYTVCNYCNQMTVSLLERWDIFYCTMFATDLAGSMYSTPPNFIKMNTVYIYMILLVKCLALWGERERSGRHYSDQYTVQHLVQQPGRTLFLNNILR